MHAEPRRRVHLDNRAADLLVAFGDVGDQEIHAAHIQPDRLDGAFGHVLVVGVADIGHVDRGAAGRQVGGRAQIEHLALGQHRRRRMPRLRHQPFGLRIQFQIGQHLFMADAAARVRVHHLHQFGDGAFAVAHHMARHPLGHRHQLAVHHQHAGDPCR